MLDGIRSDSNLEASRRAAFKALSGLFGVRAKVRFSLYGIGPVKANGRSDISLVAGLAGLCRLRPIGALPIFTTRTTGLNAERPLVEAAEEDGASAFLLRDFSSFPPESARTVRFEGGMRVEFADAPIGRIGEADLYFGHVLPDAYAPQATEGDDLVELMTKVHLPAERLVSLVYVHRSLGGLDSIDASWHATMSSPLEPAIRQRQTTLPIDAGLRLVDGAADALEWTGLEGSAEMARLALAAIGTVPEDCRLYVVDCTHPPAPATLLVRWDLPSAGS
jgi:hypothetical protein